MAEYEKIKNEIAALAELVTKEDVTKEAAKQKLEGLTILLTQKNKDYINALFERMIIPSELFEKSMAEVKARKSKYSLEEGLNTINATLRDNPLMTAEHKKLFIDAVASNINRADLE